MSSVSGSHARTPGQLSGISVGMSSKETRKLQELKVNRVAIIQTLKVEHVLPYLLDQHVFDEEDKNVIMSVKTTQARTRILLDLLPKKGKHSDWYRHFRSALKNPDTRSNDIKKKYLILLDFLDNTVMPSITPRSPINSADLDVEKMTLPRYDTLPGIQKTDLPMRNGSLSRVTFAGAADGEGGCEKGMSESQIPENHHKVNTTKSPALTLIKGYFHKWVPAPDNFVSLVKEPSTALATLEKSDDPEDKALLHQEKEALRKVHDLETVIALDRRGKLPEGMELCMSSAADQLLSDPDLFHLFVKYFQQLQEKNNLDIPSELAGSYCNIVDEIGDATDEEMREHITKMGFALFDFLEHYGAYHRAEAVLTALLRYLSTNQVLETWMAMWEAFIKLMNIRNTNVNFTEADWLYNSALRMADKIKLMSFGKDLLDESRMYTELSRMMREQGSITPCYSWAQSAVKEVEADNHHGIIDVLCNASLAYSVRFNVKKAEELAVETVKFAKKFYGANHPMYVQALLHYCHYSSEFRQDTMGVQVARAALRTAEKIYGDGCNIVIAQAHQALCLALIVHQEFTADEYYEHAIAAWKMAMDVIPGFHPRLALFRYTLAQALMWKATHGSSSQMAGTLIWAETEAQGALSIFKVQWGEYSLKTAQAYTLLGQIAARMDKCEEAEQMLQSSFTIHRLGVSSRSQHMFLIKATLGAYYKSVDRPLDALDLLKEVVDEVDSVGVYLKWVHLCYDTLIELYRAINHEKDADLYQAALIDWMKKNPKPQQPITWEQLHARPGTYEEFFAKFDSAGTKLKSVKKGLKNLKANMSASERV